MQLDAVPQGHKQSEFNREKKKSRLQKVFKVISGAAVNRPYPAAVETGRPREALDSRKLFDRPQGNATLITGNNSRQVTN